MTKDQEGVEHWAQYRLCTNGNKSVLNHIVFRMAKNIHTSIYVLSNIFYSIFVIIIFFHQFRDCSLFKCEGGWLKSMGGSYEFPVG